MAIITIKEAFYAIVITGVLAYIFMDFIKPKSTEFYIYKKSGFDFESFKFAAMVAAPGVILHEFGHKISAIILGYNASFEIMWFGLFLGLFLKLISSPFLLIAPGYVNIGTAPPLDMSIIAFCGPLVNLILWLGSAFILNKSKNLKRRQAEFLYLTKRINMILFIFNMIPFPPLDGYKVLSGIIQLF